MDQTTIEQVIAGAAGRPALTEIESKRLLEAAGITTAMAEHARAFRTKLVTLQGALYDERLYRSLH